MRGNGRRVSVFVNESALKAWLTGGKPANSPTTTVQAPTSRSTAGRTEDPKDKRG